MYVSELADSLDPVGDIGDSSAQWLAPVLAFVVCDRLKAL
jgi:hypothetical protein